MLIENTFQGTVEGTVRWWLLHIPTAHEPPDDLLADLDEMERQRLYQYRQRADRARFAAVRGTLRRLLAERLGTSPRDVAFETGARGKPRLGGGARGWCFNVSHSGAWGVIAIAPDTACEAVGIDIEQCVPVAPLPLAEVAFSAREAASLAALPDEAARMERFYTLWTVREAHAKATATGIADPRWQATTFLPAATSSTCREWHADDGGTTRAWTLPLPDNHADLLRYRAAIALSGPFYRGHFIGATLSGPFARPNITPNDKRFA